MRKLHSCTQIRKSKYNWTISINISYSQMTTLKRYYQIKENKPHFGPLSLSPVHTFSRIKTVRAIAIRIHLLLTHRERI